jgi:hypothetical protein
MRGTLQFLGVVVLVIGGFATVALLANEQWRSLGIAGVALELVLLVALLKSTALHPTTEGTHES